MEQFRIQHEAAEAHQHQLSTSTEIMSITAKVKTNIRRVNMEDVASAMIGPTGWVFPDVHLIAFAKFSTSLSIRVVVDDAPYGYTVRMWPRGHFSIFGIKSFLVGEAAAERVMGLLQSVYGEEAAITDVTTCLFNTTSTGLFPDMPSKQALVDLLSHHQVRNDLNEGRSYIKVHPVDHCKCHLFSSGDMQVFATGCAANTSTVSFMADFFKEHQMELGAA